ncbi:hypothetical protein Scep_024597 [Stephania cephalantha]|uniref:Calcineurin-binding protein 1 n=1 Tax=Stephania cephalantha TaxID=152367 RepID=A0AAP0EZQ9_9MAGN
MYSVFPILDVYIGGSNPTLCYVFLFQEFHLSQTYHEGLLKLQAKEYAMARELLEAVLKDPLVSSVQVENNVSDGHILQLRFLTLKNLATVFLQQGPSYYENALHCYLQAVEIDAKDSVVWNQLGTLSCSMGLLSMARWAFEQGLFCSPNNWNCMEKLLEVLIAIRDEVSALSMADLILRSWPSHSRALDVKNTIQQSDPIPFAPRGIDLLEPKHARLIFAEKRKRNDENSEKSSSKKLKRSIEVQLVEPSWADLSNAILKILNFRNGATDEVVGHSHNPMEGSVDLKQAKISNCNVDAQMESRGPLLSERCGNIKLSIQLPSSSENMVEYAEKRVFTAHENMTLSEHGMDRANAKEREPCADDEHPQERRSTRLERLRSRKPGKDGLDFTTSKDLAKVVIQFLEPFIISRPKYSAHAASVSSSPDVSLNISSAQQNEVQRFVKSTINNYGAYHMGHMFLEEAARLCIPSDGHSVKFLELEKFTRCWGQDRSADCCLFLAELYHDFGLLSVDMSKRSELFSESSYHLCKVIELVALDFPVHQSGKLNFEDVMATTYVNANKNSDAESDSSYGNNNITSAKNSQSANILLGDGPVCEKDLLDNPTLNNKSSFWARYFWLSGCLSISGGEKEKAFNEFSLSLLLLRNAIARNGSIFVSRPHCKLTRELTLDRVLHEIRLLKVDYFLKENISLMIEKEMYLECVNLLAPLLLSSTEVYLDMLPRPCKESEQFSSIELSALEILIMACEKAKPMDIEVFLNCHRRKLQLLTVAAGMDEYTISCKVLDRKSMPKPGSMAESEPVESIDRSWRQLVAQEVQAISQCTSQVKSFIDQCGSSIDYHVPVSSIGDIQVLLLTVTCNTIRRFLCKRSSGPGAVDQMEQLEIQCFVDSAIVFCKLQHLDQSVPVKAQVELIVAIHELLAEYGLCCAGKDSNGEGGTFLKFAIKHLLALDMKAKSIIHYSNKGLEVIQHNQALLPDGQSITPANDINLCDSSILDAHQIEKDEAACADMVAKECLTSEGTYVDGCENGADGNSHLLREQESKGQESEHEDDLSDTERSKVELGIDNALNQCFFCLYGLNLRSTDSSYDDDLAMHKNTSRGDYQTKEQCVDVFQYILPYVKASSRASLVKLRRVLRAIRKQFPQPPEDFLRENSIEKFLDKMDLCEDKLSEKSGSDEFLESIMNMIFPNGRRLKQCKTLAVGSSDAEVYGNLYHFLAQAEEMSATDKWPGFVLTKEGEDFVQQNANLFKYDLLYNPLRFDSWQKLANIYDEEVDLLLNDGSKHVNVVGWRKNPSLLQRVETSRRRSRRCLMMSLALAKTPAQQSEMHELLALVFYDGLQNVVPIYDQRSVIRVKDAAWMSFCQNSLKHFEKAFAYKADWSHAFYMGKLCEKLGYLYEKAFSYYEKAITLNPSAVDPVYRMHASRLKLLFRTGKNGFDALKVIAAYSYNPSTKAAVMRIIDSVCSRTPVDDKESCDQANSEDPKYVEPQNAGEAWDLLHKDCIYALEACVEGELKHFHKARYMLARGWYRRGESGDVERAKEELSFCFKSSRSSFTINMWEIDSNLRKGRRKTPGLAGNKKILEVNLPESSRKFITCIRKYILFYLKLLQETGDVCTLDRAYTSIRTDKRFSLCLEDLVPVALGRFLQALISSIQSETVVSASISGTCEHLLERMFNLFMDQVNLWADVSALPDIKSPEISENGFYGYLHQYINLLERDLKLDTLEGINEKIRKRFKNPKLSNSSSAKVCKHASVAWYRAIVVSLALITPLPSEVSSVTQVPHTAGISVESSLLLYLDIKEDELWASIFDDAILLRDLESKWSHLLSKMKGIVVKQALEKNMEAANALLKYSYNFYRECSNGTLPSGINLFTSPIKLKTEAPPQPGMDGVEIIDLSIPRKLLLWANTLVKGHYSNILVVVKHCEENVKSKMRKGAGLSSASSHTNAQAQSATTQSAGVKERGAHEEYGEASNNQSTAAPSLPEGEGASDANAVPCSGDAQKISIPASQLQQCNTLNAEKGT